MLNLKQLEKIEKKLRQADIELGSMRPAMDFLSDSNRRAWDKSWDIVSNLVYDVSGSAEYGNEQQRKLISKIEKARIILGTFDGDGLSKELVNGFGAAEKNLFQAKELARNPKQKWEP